MDLQEYLNEAYSAIYRNLPEALPEFEFELLPDGKGYRSSNRLKIDGNIGDRKSVVYVYADAIFGLKDYTRGFISIYTYLQNRYNLNPNEVLQKIAELSGLDLPKKADKNNESEAYKQAIQVSELLESANSFFIDCLSHSKNEFANSKKAAELRNYLLQVRGYHVGHLRLPESNHNWQKPQMELGFMPGWAAVLDFLQKQGFALELIEQHLKIPKAAEQTHILTIPYRNKIGIIKGFAFRCTQELDNTPKYLYSSGLERGNILFNLRKNSQIQDLVLVEGVLDALNASANGLLHVVAIGGADLTQGQLQEILAANPQRITLCLDNDEAGRLGTGRALKKLLPHSQKISLYVAQLPENIKDLDELIRVQGIEKSKLYIQQAISIGKYFSHILSQHFQQQIKGLEQVPDKALEELLQKTIETELSLKSPIDAAIFRQTMLELLGQYTITTDILSQKAGELQSVKKQKEYLDKLTRLQQQIAGNLQQGKIEDAEVLFGVEFPKIKAESKTERFEHLLQTQSEQDLRAAIQDTPKGFYSGYDVQLADQKIPILLPAGAISFFCAPTSHGKTTMLVNLALNVATQYPEHRVHIFSYEEAKEPVTLKALNAFTDKDLGINNLQTLEQYFSAETGTNIEPKAQKDFEHCKESFFKDLMGSKRLNIHYVDYGSEDLIDAIRFLRLKGQADIVFIDYMQLLQLTDSNRGRLSRQEELKRICIDLKDCAIETGLPLVLGAQFNREVVNPFRVHATKIGEAGDIERIASVVVGMWNNDFEPGNLFADEEMRLDEVYRPNTIWVKLLKNRNGRVGGHSLLAYNGNRGKIYSNAQTTTQNAQNTGGNAVIKF